METCEPALGELLKQNARLAPPVDWERDFDALEAMDHRYRKAQALKRAVTRIAGLFTARRTFHPVQA